MSTLIDLALLSGAERFGRAMRSLSWDRLTAELVHCWHQAVTLLTSTIGQVLIALCVGAAIGWLTASGVLHYRWRRGSLVLRDPRQPDIDFGDAALRVADLHHRGDIDRARAELITAAADGLIGLWFPTRTGLLRRVTPRALRREHGRIILSRYDMCRLVWSELTALLPTLAGAGPASRAIVDAMATVSSATRENRPGAII